MNDEIGTISANDEGLDLLAGFETDVGTDSELNFDRAAAGAGANVGADSEAGAGLDLLEAFEAAGGEMDGAAVGVGFLDGVAADLGIGTSSIFCAGEGSCLLASLEATRLNLGTCSGIVLGAAASTGFAKTGKGILVAVDDLDLLAALVTKNTEGSGVKVADGTSASSSVGEGVAEF